MSDSWDGLPGLAWVEETGLAVVHEGEAVVPALGSDAAFRQLEEDALATVEYVFPVEITLRSVTTDRSADGDDARLASLAHHLRNG